MLLLTDTIKPMVDGVSVFVDNVLPLLHSRYDITVLAPDYGPAEYEGVSVKQYPVRLLKTGDYGLPKINRKIIKQEVKSCDFIFNNESIVPFSTSFYALLYARKYHKPFFTYIHALDWELFSKGITYPPLVAPIIQKILKLYGRLFLTFGDVTIVPFQKIKTILQQNKVGGEFAIIPVGTIAQFRPGTNRYTDPQKLTIGYSGRISFEKGVDMLVRVFHSLSDSYDNLQLLLVGSGPDRENFERNNHVTITGFVTQEEVAEYVRSMDIFVLPSVTETSSISTLEAMKSGVCCIVTKVGCIEDYVNHGVNGLFFSTEDELRECLRQVIENKTLRQTIQKNAALRTASYTWKNTVTQLTCFFNKYLKKKEKRKRRD